MTRSTVCLLCRLALGRSRIPRRILAQPQRLAQVSYATSASQFIIRDKPSPPNARSSDYKLDGLHEEWTKKSSQPSPTTRTPHMQKQLDGNPDHEHLSQPDATTGLGMETMFGKMMKRWRVAGNSSASQHGLSDPQASYLQSVRDLLAKQELGCNAMDQWQLFEEELAHKREVAGQVRHKGFAQEMDQAGLRLLDSVVQQWCSDPASTRLLKQHPSTSSAKSLTPTTARAGLEAMLDNSSQLWKRTLWPLLVSLLSEDGRKFENYKRLLNEVSLFWQAWVSRLAWDPASGSRESWSRLPTPGELDTSPAFGQELNYCRRFFQVFPRFEDSLPMETSLPAGALVSSAIFAESLKHPAIDTTRPDYLPFMKLIGKLALQANMKPAFLTARQELEARGAPACIYEQSSLGHRIENSLHIALGEKKKKKKNSSDSRSTTLSHRNKLFDFWNHRIARTEQSPDGLQLRELWYEAQERFTRDKQNEFYAPVDIVERFLQAATAIRQPSLAVEIWENASASGAPMRVRAWNIILDGCRRARDPAGLQAVWGRMRASGVEPDQLSWSAKVQCLIASDRIKAGFEALDEMYRLWEQDQRQQLRSKSAGKIQKMEADETLRPDVAKPNIAVVNVAVTELLKSRLNKEVSRVLGWAKAQGIQPDAATYNIFIGDALRRHKPKEVQQLLYKMQARQISPDDHTISHILNARFRNSNSMAPNDSGQTNTDIISFLNDLLASGFKPNTRHYAIIIDSLLKHYRNIDAARAVLAHMHSQGHQPTPHIYTMFVTYYFDQNPPNTDAVLELCSSFVASTSSSSPPSSSNQFAGNVNSVFFDRVIEGYAKLGDIGNMMAALNYMDQDSRQPGWHALTLVVRKLVDSGERANAQRIVDAVRSRSGLMAAGVRGRIWHMNQFWATVQDCSLKIGEPAAEVQQRFGDVGLWSQQQGVEGASRSYGQQRQIPGPWSDEPQQTTPPPASMEEQQDGKKSMLGSRSAVTAYLPAVLYCGWI